jgi:hypothetical protein
MADRKSSADVAELGQAPDAEQLLTVLTGFVARLAVKASTGRDSASFRQIIMQELRLGSHADVDIIEAWLTSHPPAR